MKEHSLKIPQVHVVYFFKSNIHFLDIYLLWFYENFFINYPFIKIIVTPFECKSQSRIRKCMWQWFFWGSMKWYFRSVHIFINSSVKSSKLCRNTSFPISHVSSLDIFIFYSTYHKDIPEYLYAQAYKRHLLSPANPRECASISETNQTKYHFENLNLDLTLQCLWWKIFFPI